MTTSAPPSALEASEQSEAAAQGPLLIALGVATFMVGLDGRVVAPLLPTIAAEFNLSMAEASWLVSGYMLPYGFCQLAYGPLADRFGKVRVATSAMVIFSVGTALCGAFSSFAMIVLFRALTGAAAAALIPLTIAYIGDTVPYQRRQAALGMLMASTGAAQAFSTSAGGTIAALVSWRSVFPLLGALAALATGAMFVYRGREIRKPRDATQPRYAEVLRAPQLKALLLMVGIEGFLFSGAFPFLSGLLEQRFAMNALAIGLLLGIAGAAQLASAWFLPRILRRLSERSLLALGGSAMGTAYLLSAVAPSAAWVGGACLLLGIGFIFMHTTLQTRATEAFPRSRGMTLALFAFSLFGGAALGTTLLGYASDWFGYGVMFSAVAVAFVAFTWVAVASLPRRHEA